MIQHQQNKILLYINGELSEKEKILFEQELFKSKELQQLHAELKQSDLILKKSLQINEAPGFRISNTGKYKLLSIAAGILAVFILSILAFKNDPSEEIDLSWQDNNLNQMLVLQLEMESPLILGRAFETNNYNQQNFNSDLFEIENSVYQIQKND